MKIRKLFGFVLAAAMLLCAVPAMAAGTGSASAKLVPESALEMTLSPTVVTDNNSVIEITLTNKSTYTTYNYGTTFSLEAAVDGKWSNVSGYGGYYASTGYSLAPGKSVTLKLSLAGYALTSGTYYHLVGTAYDTRCRVRETVSAVFVFNKTAASQWHNNWSNNSSSGNATIEPSYTYYEYRYATERVNVRTGPSTSYKIIGVLNAGEQVKLTGYTGKWSQVIYNGQVAYVFTKYLTATAPTGGNTVQPIQPTESTTLYTTANLNFRKGPGTKYGIIGTINAGTPVTYLGTSGNWTKVSCGGYTGYLFTKYLTTKTSTTGNIVIGSTVSGYVPGYGWVENVPTTGTSVYVPGYGWIKTDSVTTTPGSAWKTGSSATWGK